MSSSPPDSPVEPRPASPIAPAPTVSQPSGARWVAVGILASKVFGLGREVAIASLFGVAAHADVWRNALRAPNVLQNLLGEQTLSAAFIPIYSRMVEEGRREDASRFAGAVLGWLAVTAAALVTLGVLFAPQIVAVLTPGFLGDAAKVAAGEATVDRYRLLVDAVRIVFPMTGFLVISAWALGILNSHRRFLLPYVAPVVWNLSIIAALVGTAAASGYIDLPESAPDAVLTRWLMGAAIGALVGGALQLAVQLPTVLRLLGGLRPSLDRQAPGVREALRAVGPALAGRGVVQLSLYLDTFLASFLAAGAPSAIAYAGTLVNLPLAVFGMSVAAAELPELSRSSPAEAAERVPARVRRGLRQSAFVVAPSVVGYLVFGFLIAALLFRRGSFDAGANVLVAAVLAAYALGLFASTLSRLLQNAFFALRDTKTPARIATVRLVASATLGIGLMLPLDRIPVAMVLGASVDPAEARFFGAVGLALASSVAAWAELVLLLRGLRQRLPALRLPLRALGAHVVRSLVAAVPAAGAWWLLRGWADGGLGLSATALVVLGLYGAAYLGLSAWRGIEELDWWLGRLRRRRSAS